MKKTSIIILLYTAVTFISCNHETKKNNKQNAIQIDSTDQTNNFYDNVESYQLPIKDILIEGEVKSNGKLDFSKMNKHSVIVKEAVLDGDSNKFIGAYRYDGYSLFDILNNTVLKKINEKEFKPIIDLYVEIENDKGEKVILSWGEIYYPNHLNEIIIATDVRRIVPSKTKELWPLPTESKLVVSSDLLTERNISSPSKITVHSYRQSFKTVKGMKPCFSPDIKIFVNDSLRKNINEYPTGLTLQHFNTIFYGRGRGIHSTTPFNGVLFKDVLSPYTKSNKEMIQKGMVAVVGADGYRSVFTFSELMNRNDQSEILLICNKNVTDDGIFRLFPACDFFSDRAIKAISEIRILDKY